MSESIFSLEIPDADDAVQKLGIFQDALGGVGNLLEALQKSGGIWGAIGGFGGDSLSAKDSLDAISELDFRIEDVGTNLALLHTEMANAPDHMVQVLIDREKELKSELGDLILVQQEYNKELAETGRISKKRDIGGMDDFGMGGGFGMGPGSEISGMLQSLSQFAGYDSGLGNAMNEMSNLMSTGDQLSSTFSNMSQMAGQSNNVLGKFASKGLGGLSKAAGPATAAIAGINLGMTAFDAMMGKSTAAIRKNLEAQQDALDLELERNDLLESGTTESLTDDIRGYEAANEDVRESIRGATDDIAENTGSWDQIRSVVTDWAGGSHVYGDAAEQIRGWNKEIADNNAAIALRQEIMDDVKAREEAEAAARRVDDAERDLAATRADAESSIADFAEELADTADDFKWEDARTGRERQRADEAAAESHTNALSDIHDDYYDRTEEMAEEHGKNMLQLETQFREEMAAIGPELASQGAELSAQYMASRTEELSIHLESMTKAETEWQKQRKRMLEDHLDALNDAEANNNVVAFLEAQRAHEKEMGRAEEDNAEQVSEAEREFGKSREERRVAFEKELAELRTQSDTRRQELITQYQKDREQAKKAYKEQQEQEFEQAQERLDEEKERYEEEQKLEAERRKVEDEEKALDRERQLEKMEEGHQKEMDLLEDRERSALDIIQSGGQAQLEITQDTQQALVDIMGAGAQSMVQILQDMFSKASSSGKGGGGRGRRRVAAARGALIDEPTLLVAGEAGPELVIPFEPSQGIPSGLGGGPAYEFNFGDVNLGGISHTEFSEGMRGFALTIIQATKDAPKGVRGQIF